jgi:hypothetical protein
MIISVPSAENRQNIIAYLKTLKPWAKLVGQIAQAYAK